MSDSVKTFKLGQKIKHFYGGALGVLTHYGVYKPDHWTITWINGGSPTYLSTEDLQKKCTPIKEEEFADCQNRKCKCLLLDLMRNGCICGGL